MKTFLPFVLKIFAFTFFVCVSYGQNEHSDWFNMSVTNQLYSINPKQPFQDAFRIQNTSFQLGFERRYTNHVSIGLHARMGKVNDFRSELISIAEASYNRGAIFGLQTHVIRYFPIKQNQREQVLVPYVLGGLSFNGIQEVLDKSEGGFDLQVPIQLGLEAMINPKLCGRISAGYNFSAKMPHRTFALGFAYTLQNELDTDQDGIPDMKDMCPEVPGTGSNYGCPDQDMDEDGVPDYLDECPTIVGKLNGCPDSDGDMIADAFDDCPDVAGPTNGCPVEIPEKNIDQALNESANDARIKSVNAGAYDPLTEANFPKFNLTDVAGLKVITRGNRADGIVYFEPNSTFIRLNDKRVLMLVSAVLMKNPEAHITIVGYTDLIGDTDYNLKLSENRARATAKMLIDDGVQPSQIRLVGLGEAINVDGLEDNHAFHRRVEIYFHM